MNHTIIILRLRSHHYASLKDNAVTLSQKLAQLYHYYLFPEHIPEFTNIKKGLGQSIRWRVRTGRGSPRQTSTTGAAVVPVNAC